MKKSTLLKLEAAVIKERTWPLGVFFLHFQKEDMKSGQLAGIRQYIGQYL